MVKYLILILLLISCSNQNEQKFILHECRIVTDKIRPDTFCTIYNNGYYIKKWSTDELVGNRIIHVNYILTPKSLKTDTLIQTIN